ncbi:MAG: inositol monophosphatase family protein [Candidatus Woesearchaeota archaeon]|jgi:myo-inositol-1(or 4)-monophosphatase|nr:inositol monophosphatase family protein [Candidatus Woesearchaeota archaeon]
MNNKQVAILAAKKADKIILTNYNKIKKVTKKATNNFVTDVDLAAEKAIINTIKKHTNHSILSEEIGKIDNNSDYRWIIDPIDGTHNYMHGFPIFGVNIALEYKKELILGLITLPTLNQVYIAEKGKGAYLNNKKITVSNITNLKDALIIGASKLYKKSSLNYMKKISKKIFKIRTVECAVFGLAVVAAGNADAYVMLQTNPWDVAAGIILINEAGGKITDLKGNKADQYSKKLVLSNKKLHTKLINITKTL